LKTWKVHLKLNWKKRKGASFTAGLTLQFINPKIYITVIAMLTFILPYFDSSLVRVVFAFFLALVGFVMDL